MTTQTIETFKIALLNAVDARIEYEARKSNNDASLIVDASNANATLRVVNASMHKTLKDIRESVENDAVVSVMLASNCDANAINKSERANARRNVYSYEKDVNIARAIKRATTLNHYTVAIFKALVALDNAKMHATHSDLSSACSLDVKSDDKARETLIKACKYQKHVVANTASTQSSSSINALLAFNVVSEIRDEKARVAYALNREAHATKAIAALLSITL